MHDGGAWAWPCPYCRTSNALDAATCVSCGAQLRDPDEDDLFTTVATHNAQMVEPDAPRVNESLWSTEAPPTEVVAEEVPDPPGPPSSDPAGANAPGAPAREAESPRGPFSRTAPSASGDRESASTVFAAGSSADSNAADRESQSMGSGPFGVSGAAEPAPQNYAASQPLPPPVQPAQPVSQMPAAAADPFAEQRDQTSAVRPTPDEHGLSVAVDSLDPLDRERCETPIAVCGALLGEQEVVLAVLAGHLLGHPAVVALTSARVLVANARRWKPLVDQFLPGSDLTVHLRHDRDVASITFVQGDRLTGVDDITDVAAAVDLAERIKAVSLRAAGR